MKPDVVVIGAGILGSCTALELARAGISVTVVEKTGVGQGSTGASSAVVRQAYGRSEAVHLALDSLRAWEVWDEYAEVPRDKTAAKFHRTGVLLPVPEASTLKPQADLMRSCGAAVDVLTPDEILSRHPGWVLEGVKGALFEPEGGYVDQPDLAAINAADAARALGARIVIDRVTGLNIANGRIEGIELAKAGALPCGAVINAAGPWSLQINRMAGVSIPLVLERHRTILVPTQGNTADLPTVGDLAANVYFRPDPSQGGILVGSFDEKDGLPCPDPDACDPTVDRAFYEEKCLAVARRMPEIVRFPPWVRGIAGLYDVHEPDWYPVFDRTEVEGFLVAVGTSGAWFKGGPSIGALMTHLLKNGRTEFTLPRTGASLDPAFFRRDRPPIDTSFAGGVVG